MKFCHKCGAQCEDGAKFCKQCGAALADVNANQSQQTYEVPRQAQYTSADTNNSQMAMEIRIIRETRINMAARQAA